MLTRLFHIVVLLLLLNSNHAAQARFTLHVAANYTTTAKMYLSPASSDPSVRNRYYELQGIVSPSLELRYQLSEELAAGVSTEVIGKTDGGRPITVLSNGITRSVQMQDGFTMVPIELNLYYSLPFSSETFRLFINGGMAYYIGWHVRKIGGIRAEPYNRRAAYGIQVGILSEYRAWRAVFITGGMKFRDPLFQLSSKYTAKKTMLDGRTIELAQEYFESKINVDGVTFFIGASWEFGD